MAVIFSWILVPCFTRMVGGSNSYLFAVRFTTRVASGMGCGVAPPGRETVSTTKRETGMRDHIVAPRGVTRGCSVNGPFFAPQRPIRINFFNPTPVAKDKCQRYVNGVLSTIRGATPSWDQSGRRSVREWRRQFPTPRSTNAVPIKRIVGPRAFPCSHDCDPLFNAITNARPAAIPLPRLGNLRREDDAQNVPAGNFEYDANSEFAGSLQNGVRDDAVESGGCQGESHACEDRKNARR